MKKLKLLLLTVALPVVAVSLWGFVALRDNKTNGFSRTFLDIATLKYSTQAPILANTFIGEANDLLYFRTKEHNQLLEYNQDLSKHVVKIFQVEQNATKNSDYSIDSNGLKIYAGNIHAVINISFKSVDSNRTLTLNTTPFADALEYTKDRFIIRGFALKEKDYVLQKVDEHGEVIATEQNVSTLKHELGLSTQTNLLYNPNTGRAFLIYRLFNGLTCFDTNLNLIYKKKTIDTISTTSFTARKVKERGRAITGTYSSAPKFTNYTATLNDKYLFVHSRLKADNQYTTNAIIDVYEQQNGNYKYSFELPQTVGKQLLNINIKDRRLIAVFAKNKTINIYHLDKLP